MQLTMDPKTLLGFINEVEAVTKKPEKYLNSQEKESEEIKNLIRNLYNFTKKNETSKGKARESLDQLIILNLDEEQIWQQIELQNNAICKTLIHDVAHLLTKKNNLRFPLKETENKSKENKNRHDSEKSNEESEKEECVVENKKILKNKNKTYKSSIVDDKFFRLYEMEYFLDKMEKEEKGDEESDNEEIDYFEDEGSDANYDSEDQLHYNDFFDQPENEEYVGGKKRKDFELDAEEEKKTKKVKFSIEDEEDDLSDNDDFEDGVKDEIEDENESDYEDENDEIEDEDEENNIEYEKKNIRDLPEHKSTFEARQERLRTRINKLEEEALKEKPWQLKGEVTAKSRPQNSLLQEYVEFDIASRPAPVFTEKTTLKLEDVITQRIKDKAWDDVVRKIKPVENDMEYKKKLVLDQEKSKLSLAQIYEQEYLKQLDSKNEDLADKPELEPPEHQEIRIMMNKLFFKLDALSNFHFTPKQVEPEVKIISNLPAITMEEVAPVATADATLLAPEEVKANPKGDLIGKTERTSTDKKRERRKKKLKQKLKYQQLEAKAKLNNEKQDLKKFKNQKMSDKLLQRITKNSSITQLKENQSGKYIKSSSAVFSKLQDVTSSKVGKKSFEMKKKKSSGKLNLINSKKR